MGGVSLAPSFRSEGRNILLQPLPLDKFSVRLSNFLRANHYWLIGDAVGITEHDLRRAYNVGKTTQRELKDYLSTLGVPIGSEIEWPCADHAEKVEEAIDIHIGASMIADADLRNDLRKRLQKEAKNWRVWRYKCEIHKRSS